MMHPRPLSIAIERLIVSCHGGQTDEDKVKAVVAPVKTALEAIESLKCRTPVYTRPRTEHWRFLPNFRLHLPIPDPKVRSNDRENFFAADLVEWGQSTSQCEENLCFDICAFYNSRVYNHVAFIWAIRSTWRYLPKSHCSFSHVSIFKRWWIRGWLASGSSRQSSRREGQGW